MTIAALDLVALSAAVPRLRILTEEKGRLDEAAKGYAAHVRDEIRTLLGSLRWFNEDVGRILRDAAAGKAGEIQAMRGAILDAFQSRLMLLLGACRLGRHAEQITGRPLPDLTALEAEADAVGQRLMSLAIHWQKAEDLADMTDEKLGQRVSAVEFRRLLSPEQRDEIMRRSAEVAEEVYRTDSELLGFEAFGEGDFYDDYPDAEPG